MVRTIENPKALPRVPDLSVDMVRILRPCRTFVAHCRARGCGGHFVVHPPHARHVRLTPGVRAVVVVVVVVVVAGAAEFASL